MKIVTIVGARPQFVKTAIVSRQIAALPDVQECIVHTGQHYDARLSQVFFDELNIPRPTHQLQVGSAPHGRQTGQMLAELEAVLEQERPDVVLVYGDTNSTLAGALAAAKMHIPIAHVEAGLRSFNRRMPEEVNRVLTDSVSSLLLCPTDGAVDNLRREGVRAGVHCVGDVMYDASMHFAEHADEHVSPLVDYGLTGERFALMTCHRAENTDDPTRLAAILQSANELASQLPVLFPVHPRTRSKLTEADLQPHPGLRLIDPLSYLEMLVLERSAALILTDSGGVQKEAFFFGVPCVTMRDETEWVETVETGANIVAGARLETIRAAVHKQLGRSTPLPDAGDWYGNGQAASRVAGHLQQLGQRNAKTGRAA